MYVRVTGPAGQFAEGGRKRWPLPAQNPDGTWKPGRWVEIDPESPRHLWLSGVTPEHIGDALLRLDGQAWVIEYEGAVIQRYNGVMGTKARFVEPYPLPSWWEKTGEQASQMEQVPWLQPDGAPLPDWLVFSTRAEAYAALDEATKGRPVNATLDAVSQEVMKLAGELGRGVAYDTVWRSVEKDVQDILRALGRKAFPGTYRRKPVAAAIQSVMRDVAWDAAMCCASRVCEDMLAPEADQFLKDMWEVYRKGYALAAEVNGRLFVYGRF